MISGSLQLALSVFACTPEVDGPDPSGTDRTATPDPPKTTGDVQFGAPESIGVSCGGTDNLLRKVCTVRIEPPQSVVIEVQREDDPEPMAFESRFELGEHRIDVTFLAPGSTYDVVATARQWPDDIAAHGVITTEALPPGLDVRLDMTGTAETPLIAAAHPCARQPVAAIFDTYTGELVWLQLMSETGRFHHRTMVRFTDRGTVLGVTGEDIVEVDLMGRDQVRLEGMAERLNPGETFWKLHHDVFRRDDTLYVLYREQLEAGELDVTVLLDLEGNVIREWRPWEHLDLPADWSGNYLHTNTLEVDDNGDILMSWLIPNTVAKVVGDPDAADFGEVRWKVVGLSNWIPRDLTMEWAGVEKPDWFRNQHSVNLDGDGDLLMLDNINARGLRIRVDESTGQAIVEQSFPATSTLSQCGEQGTTQAAPNGNVLVGCSDDVVREFTADGEMLWEATPVCAEGDAKEVSRWYPLDGWRPRGAHR